MTGYHGALASQALAWLRACASARSLLSWTSPDRVGHSLGPPWFALPLSLQTSRFTPSLWCLFGLLTALWPWNLHSPPRAAPLPVDPVTGGGAEAPQGPESSWGDGPQRLYSLDSNLPLH